MSNSITATRESRLISLKQELSQLSKQTAQSLLSSILDSGAYHGSLSQTQELQILVLEKVIGVEP